MLRLLKFKKLKIMASFMRKMSYWVKETQQQLINKRKTYLSRKLEQLRWYFLSDMKTGFHTQLLLSWPDYNKTDKFRKRKKIETNTDCHKAENNRKQKTVETRADYIQKKLEHGKIWKLRLTIIKRLNLENEKIRN